MKLQAYLIAALASILLACGAYGLGRYQGGAATEVRIQAQQAGEDAAAQDRQDEVLGIVAKAIARQKPINTTVVNTAEKEIRTNTVYTDCKLPPEMQDLIRQSQLVTQ